MCTNCVALLGTVHIFRSKCLETEEKVRTFILQAPPVATEPEYPYIVPNVEIVAEVNSTATKLPIIKDIATIPHKADPLEISDSDLQEHEGDINSEYIIQNDANSIAFNPKR